MFGHQVAISGQALREALRWTADLLLPPRCVSCAAPLWGETQLCGTCWKGLTFIDAPLCEVSGIPFPYDPGRGAMSAEVLARRPAYGRARAALHYDEVSGRLVSRLKYGDRLEAVPLFAKWMVHAGGDLLRDTDLIVPVPLHRARLFQRRFNQSAEMARAVSRLSGVPCAPELLIRTRATRAQVGLSASARRRNVSGAFALTPGNGEKVAGKRLLLVDDVLTTGATVEACVKRLAAEGAVSVDVLTLARVVPQDQAPI
ncbi:MAG: ComF family protein [Rhodobiaceae bacterium]|nr:ComF family protein [Rhodobiaceae bacterium]